MQTARWKKDRELLRDSHIKKIRTDPLFLGVDGDASSEENFSAYLAGVLNVSVQQLLTLYTKQQIKKVKHLLDTRMALCAKPYVFLCIYCSEYG